MIIASINLMSLGYPWPTTGGAGILKLPLVFSLGNLQFRKEHFPLIFRISLINLHY